jgi:hypothetical protein
MASILLLHYYSPNRMADWFDNTMRTIGIILTAGFVIVVSFLLILMALCAAQAGRGGTSNDSVFFFGTAVMVILFGVLFIIRLSRGISHSVNALEPLTLSTPPFATPSGPVPASQPQAPPPASLPAGSQDAHPSIPLRLSPASRKALNRLALAMGAQILLSGITWVFNQLHFWSAPVSLAPHNWTAILFGPFVLYHLPYAFLIYFLLNQPSRRALTWSLAVPSVILLQSLFTLSLMFHYYVHGPVGFLLLFVPWSIHIAILVLAYQAIQRIGLHPEPQRLVGAAVLIFFYFSFINSTTPLLYRLR